MRLTLAAIVFAALLAVACSAGIDDEEVDRRIDAAVATALTGAIPPTPQVRYEPDLSAYMAGLDESLFFGLGSTKTRGDFPTYAAAWALRVDLGEIPDGPESFAKYSSEIRSGTGIRAESTTLLSRLLSSDGLPEIVRVRWVNATSELYVAYTCEIVHTVVKAKYGSIAAGGLGTCSENLSRATYEGRVLKGTETGTWIAYLAGRFGVD